ncbi:TIGR02452 family protein [Catalinimonas alkaloidigena]|uniref:TIGR02452 family protein n=1 Tax=Catalinimonas alkaloidigena TaxID=1075417 RepID=A0A1G9LN98_9BACT|nr:TIGR02452 family protein [Catalinimonas alkaloidigena]SDL63428.1 TIGR02452 family protein [Catalinimonas alkaloidigena]
MSSRNQRAAVAQETLTIFEEGAYTNALRQRVSVAASLAAAVQGTRALTPDAFDHLTWDTTETYTTELRVTNETTLQAAYRLVVEEELPEVACLNFASAKNPGGGFLNGSQAQEESLARASGLYLCQTAHGPMYAFHRRFASCLYTDRMIYSPRVPVIRDDSDQLLPRPYLLSIITAPAVNKGGLLQNHDDDGLRQVEAVMLERTRKVLRLALAQGHRILILGAWGCGVFRNDPVAVAGYFARVLQEAPIKNQFKKVVFAVLDTSKAQTTVRAFEEAFA